jgi:hypothetical protein
LCPFFTSIPAPAETVRRVALYERGMLLPACWRQSRGETLVGPDYNPHLPISLHRFQKVEIALPEILL